MPLGEIAGVVRRTVGSQTYYFGTIGSEKVKGITYVPVIERSDRTYVQESEEEGYQRPGSRYRMREFMRYLKDHPNSVIPPVLLSGRGWQFEPDTTAGDYGRLYVDSPAAIIDGQHRIGGYIALYEDEDIARPIDFIVLVGLTHEQEKEEFLTVNNTQKGVPRPLTSYLEDEVEARLAWALNQEEDSPFKGRITRTRIQRTNLFALHSVAKQIRRTFDHGKLESLEEDTKLEYLMRYWTIIAEEMEDAWRDIDRLEESASRGRKDFQFKLLELTGFIAWSRIGAEILGRSYTDGVGMNWENVRRLVRTCGQIDWRKDGAYQGMTGEYGAGIIKRDMERLLPADEVEES